MFDNIRGVVHFKVHGASLYPFVDEVRRQKIGMRRQKMQHDFLSADCYYSDFERIAQIAEDYKVNIKIEENKGAVFRVKRYAKRLGIVFGVILTFAVTFYFSNVVTQIEINGCEIINQSTVANALRDCGIVKGAFIPDIDFESCERRIMLAIDDIAWVGIRNTGGRIVVDIDEMVYKPEMLDENTPCNIVALYDAQIVEMNVLEGVGCAQTGYTVHKGDILISGVQEGIKGATTVKHALGSVRGIYNITVSFTQNLTEVVRVETDNTDNKKVLDILSLEIPLYFKSCEYNDYNLLTKSDELYFFGKKIPIEFMTNQYSECENIVVNYAPEDAQAMLFEQMRRYEVNFLQGTEIISAKADFEITDEQAVLSVLYTLEGEIGTKNEILFKNFD